MLISSMLALLSLLAGPAAADTGDSGDPCDEWGEVYPGERVAYVGEFVNYWISGGAACGDVDTCSWWADGDRGDFLQTTGSPVTWRAPTELADCVTIDFRVWASCNDGGTTGFADVTLRCTHEQLLEVQQDRRAELTGGGCSGPISGTSTTTAAGVFLLLPGALMLRRRRA